MQRNNNIDKDEKLRQLKYSADTKITNNYEEYLTCILKIKLVNDDKVQNEIKIDSKRANNYINTMEKGKDKFEENNTRVINEKNYENNNFILKKQIKIDQNMANLINIKTSEGSRNTKNLYENSNTTSKPTREERFQSFLTKYSQNLIPDSNDTKAKMKSIKATEKS